MEVNVIEWLEATAAKNPDKIAFRDSEKCINFSYVINHAKAIGSAIAAKGIYRKPVAVISGRHCLTPVSFLGVVYSGCFYAPIDSHLPIARINTILETLSPSLVITDRENADFIKKLLI